MKRLFGKISLLEMHQKVKHIMMQIKILVLSGNIPTLLVLHLLVSQVICLDWLEHHKPVQKTSYLYNTDELSSSSDSFHNKLEELSEFHGNNSHTDHFKLLKEDGTSVLVGARNVIYNLSLPNLIEYTEEVICQFKLKILTLLFNMLQHPTQPFFLQILKSSNFHGKN